MKYMKKIALAMVLGISCMGMVSCSGDDENGGILDTIINLIGGLFNQGETYTYNIEVSQAKIWTNLTNKDSINWSDTTTFTGQTVQLVANNNQATLTLPDYKWQSAEIKGLTLYNLDITANGDFTTLSIGENTSIDGTFTITKSGKTYAAFYCDLTTATVSQTDILVSGTVQFANAKADGTIDDSDVQQLDIITLMKSTPAQ